MNFAVSWHRARVPTRAARGEVSIHVAQVQSGELAFPAGDTAEPFVDLDDVADVAVEADAAG